MAVITRMSAARPLARGPCAGARRSGAARRPRRGGGRGRPRPSGRARGCRPGWRSRRPRARRACAARSAPLSRPVRRSRRTPAASASGASEARCWRARISVGAISAAWPPASTAASMASSATSVLPDADVALQQAVHPQGRGHVGGDLGDRAGLGGGRGVGQGGESPASRRRPSPRVAKPLGALHAGAGEREGHLVGEQLVVGEPLAGRARPARGRRGGRGRGRAASAARQSGHPRRRDEARLDPFRQLGGAGQRLVRRRGSWGAGSGPRSADRPARRRAASSPGRRMWSGWTIWARPSKSSTRPETMRRWPPAACGAATPRGRGRRRAGTRSARRGRGRGRGGCARWPGRCRPTSTSTVRPRAGPRSAPRRAAGGRPRRSAG